MLNWRLYEAHVLSSNVATGHVTATPREAGVRLSQTACTLVNNESIPRSKPAAPVDDAWVLFVGGLLCEWKLRSWRSKRSGSNWTKELAKFRLESGMGPWFGGRRWYSGSSEVSNLIKNYVRLDIFYQFIRNLRKPVTNIFTVLLTILPYHQ